MGERLVITNCGDERIFTSRARLTSAATYAPAKDESDEALTAIGRALVAAFEAVDGVTVHWVQRHQTSVSLVHPALWTWDEVEPGIVAAWATVLGGEPEVIREGGA